MFAASVGVVGMVPKIARPEVELVEVGRATRARAVCRVAPPDGGGAGQFSPWGPGDRRSLSPPPPGGSTYRSPYSGGTLTTLGTPGHRVTGWPSTARSPARAGGPLGRSQTFAQDPVHLPHLVGWGEVRCSLPRRRGRAPQAAADRSGPGRFRCRVHPSLAGIGDPLQGQRGVGLPGRGGPPPSPARRSAPASFAIPEQRELSGDTGPDRLGHEPRRRGRDPFHGREAGGSAPPGALGGGPPLPPPTVPVPTRTEKTSSGRSTG